MYAYVGIEAPCTYVYIYKSIHAYVRTYMYVGTVHVGANTNTYVKETFKYMRTYACNMQPI